MRGDGSERTFNGKKYTFETLFLSKTDAEYFADVMEEQQPCLTKVIKRKVQGKVTWCVYIRKPRKVHKTRKRSR